MLPTVAVPAKLALPVTASVPVAVRLPPMYAFPATPNFENGDVVPIPRPVVVKRPISVPAVEKPIRFPLLLPKIPVSVSDPNVKAGPAAVWKEDAATILAD